MKKTTLYILGLTTILFTACSSKTEAPVVGKVKKDVISFTPKVTGRVLEIYVQEGDIVYPGDTLAKLDVPEVAAKKSQVEGVVKAANAQSTMAQNGATAQQRKQLNAKLKATQEQYNYAEKSYERSKAMHEEGYLSTQQFDEIKAKYNGAKAQLEAVEAQMDEVQKGVRYETREAAQGQHEQALGVLEEVSIAEAEMYVIATNVMQVETITLNVGELATAGYALFNGYIPESTYFRMTIGEKSIADYPKGRILELHIPYNNQAVQVKVQNIKQMARYADITSPYPNLEIDEAFYELKLVPTSEDPAELKDLLVNASVILKK